MINWSYYPIGRLHLYYAFYFINVSSKESLFADTTINRQVDC